MEDLIMHQRNCQESICNHYEDKISRLESANRIKDIIIKHKNKQINNLKADIVGLCKCEVI